jgi:hypothetical protein
VWFRISSNREHEMLEANEEGRSDGNAGPAFCVDRGDLRLIVEKHIDATGRVWRRVRAMPPNRDQTRARTRRWGREPSTTSCGPQVSRSLLLRVRKQPIAGRAASLQGWGERLRIRFPGGRLIVP